MRRFAVGANVTYGNALGGQRLGVRLQPPTLGQHTAALLAELGYSAARVEALRVAHAVA